jgi:uncharacterized membrane protein YbhN (UPF0104 family)
MNVYFRAQIAKYIPGNVFQYLGRNLLAKKYDWPQKTVSYATLLEIIALIFASGILALAQWIILLNPAGNIRKFLMVVLPIALYLIVSSFKYASAYLSKKLSSVYNLFNKYLDILFDLKINHLYLATLLYLAFLILSGIIFWQVVNALNQFAPPTYLALSTSIYAFGTAWMIGFIIPGAPGGIGIREAVLVFLLAAHITTETALAAVLIMRIITTVGDLIAFFLGTLSLALSKFFRKPINPP